MFSFRKYSFWIIIVVSTLFSSCYKEEVSEHVKRFGFSLIKNQWDYRQIQVQVTDSVHFKSVNWEFGDYTSAEGSHATHDYQHVGEYLVKCIAVDLNNEIFTRTKKVFIDSSYFVDYYVDTLTFSQETFSSTSGPGDIYHEAFSERSIGPNSLYTFSASPSISGDQFKVSLEYYEPYLPYYHRDFHLIFQNIHNPTEKSFPPTGIYSNNSIKHIFSVWGLGIYNNGYSSDEPGSKTYVDVLRSDSILEFNFSTQIKNTTVDSFIKYNGFCRVLWRKRYP